ncbi:MAG TPA: arsenate reductase ArsC [Pseudorhodoplanes sp.]|nr:arsenate reductase ArsC [Pseudorhodoplanes sp.]
MVELRNILYLCAGNSVRSILAEAITNRAGRGRVRAFSAGSRPKGRVHPQAIELLIDLGHETAHLRSKSLEEFTAPGAPAMDLVVTLCDEAAGEPCPLWPGHPLTAHWSIPDPAAARGPRAIRAALADCYRLIETRVHALLDLPLDGIDPKDLPHRLRDLGAEEPMRIVAWSL